MRNFMIKYKRLEREIFTLNLKKNIGDLKYYSNWEKFQYTYKSEIKYNRLFKVQFL